MNRLAPLALGAGMIAAALTGRAGLFVRPWFVPVLAVCGVAMVAVAVRGGVRLSPTAMALVLAPLIVGASLSPATVGRVTATGATAAAPDGRIGDGANPLLEGSEDPVTLLDVSVAEREVGAVALAGRRVSLTGAVDGARITRLVMVCCAADARPVGLRVTGRSLPAGGWVEVTGALTVSGAELVVRADRVEPVDTPSLPIL